MNKIIIIAPVPTAILEQLNAYSITVHYHPHIAYETLAQCIADYDGMIISTRIPIDKNILSKATHLKWIGRLGSGLDHVDIAYAKEKNITILTTPEGNAPAVGEHVAMVILALLHHLCKANNDLKQGKWTRNTCTPTELRNKVVGIVGVGNTGTAVAKALQGFGCTFIGYDKYKSVLHKTVTPVSMKTLLAESDIISFHIPLTHETHHLINHNLLCQTKKTPLIINASRGEVLVLADLIEALNSHIICGAAIDVFENENWDTLTHQQQEDLKLLSEIPNVILTPHIAGVSQEAKLRMPQLLIEKLQALKYL